MEAGLMLLRTISDTECGRVGPNMVYQSRLNGTALQTIQTYLSNACLRPTLQSKSTWDDTS
jgi:hypothetical protein